MRTRLLKLLCSALTLAGVLVCAACSSDPRQGYSFRSTFASDIRTIAVPVFSNSSPSPGLEEELTAAVIRELERTPGWLVSQSETADATLTGTIRSAELRRLSSDSVTGLSQEQSLQITVDFDFRDNRSHALLASRRNFAALDTFVPQRLSAERLETGQSGAIDRLAKDLVAQLRSGW